jgi:hypothetical protein
MSRPSTYNINIDKISIDQGVFDFSVYDLENNKILEGSHNMGRENMKKIYMAYSEQSVRVDFMIKSLKKAAEFQRDILPIIKSIIDHKQETKKPEKKEEKKKKSE